jgi:hypothetical protein
MESFLLLPFKFLALIVLFWAFCFSLSCIKIGHNNKNKILNSIYIFKHFGILGHIFWVAIYLYGFYLIIKIIAKLT